MLWSEGGERASENMCLATGVSAAGADQFKAFLGRRLNVRFHHKRAFACKSSSLWRCAYLKLSLSQIAYPTAV